ncbi:hypothetical protein SBD_5345 [Streptomyces bottropensis ATCC 25435]|uniref:Uncharacterized protein n=1 Tax=Streptomyces bottropensis ATCC 25435 TaxID=1054862 RepID=M3EC79_9ACTN|nr:hypothetical protein SBD_5345 [Streptomyces bottropensis ATCC 25435]
MPDAPSARSSLFRAGDRLGPEPLRVLFATTVKPMATEATTGAFWRGLRLPAVDGTCWDPCGQRSRRGRLREAGQRPRDGPERVSPGADGRSGGGGHACGAGRGTRRLAAPGESPLVGRLPGSYGPGQLVLADREFLGTGLWWAFTTTGADPLGALSGGQAPEDC